MEKIVITGGSGMLGTHLTKILLRAGYEVVHLGRSRNSKSGVKVFLWNPSHKYIEEGALKNADYIVHLAGEGIANKKWTSEQKSRIIHSRIDGPEFLNKYVRKNNIPLKGFFSASGINYYGSSTTENIFTESDAPSDEFVSDVVIQWEKAAHLFDDYCRVVCFRFGLILDKEEGGLSKLARPVEFGIGSPIGNGNQWMPWIHYEDAANCFLHAIKNNSVQGNYNAVATEYVTNKIFVETMGKILHVPVFFPPVPAFLIRFLFGERGDLILGGSRSSNAKLITSGFQFHYPALYAALKNIYE